MGRMVIAVQMKWLEKCDRTKKRRAGFEDAHDLPQRDEGVADMLEHRERDGRVERGVLERQRMGVGQIMRGAVVIDADIIEVGVGADLAKRLAAATDIQDRPAVLSPREVAEKLARQPFPRIRSDGIGIER